MATILPQPVPKAVPTFLSFVAGCIDSVTFLGLYGIFIAQLTGSFVLAGTQIVESEPGYLVKLLAVPVFFLAGCFATLIAALAEERKSKTLAILLTFECILLTALVLMHMTLPLTHIDAPAVRLTALTGIAAMGVQSAMVRLLMRGVASTNVMTTNTTQMAVDATLLLMHALHPSAGGAAGVAPARERMAGLLPIVIGFVSGTAAGAVGYTTIGFWTLLVPLVIAYGVCGWAFLAAPIKTETKIAAMG